MNPEPAIPLRQIRALLWGRRAFILRITLIAMLLSLAVGLVAPRKYKAETVMVLRNPLYTDRGNLFSDAKTINYFGSEDDITRLVSMAASDSLQEATIRHFGLTRVFDIDTAKRGAASLIRKEFNKALNLYVAENKDIVLLYRDKDPERAAAVANYYVPLLEMAFRDFYDHTRRSMYGAIQQKLRDQDITIAALTDSLSHLREQYGIYDIISPARHNLMLGSIKENGRPGFGKGMELIQNVESVKDEMVSDRARNQTIASQMATSLQHAALPLINVLRKAQVPAKPEGPSLFVLVLLGGLTAAFFVILYVLSAAQLRNP
jgi:uncharacterized protein involved in exopolysaccharide biosynthesis